MANKQQQDVLVTGNDLHVSKNVVQEHTQQTAEQKAQEQPEQREMPQYTARRTVRAAKLKSVDRNGDNTVTLIPEDNAYAKVQLGGKQAQAIPGWNSSTPNSDPGYVVRDDVGGIEWMGTQQFEALYGTEKK